MLTGRQTTETPENAAFCDAMIANWRLDQAWDNTTTDLSPPRLACESSERFAGREALIPAGFRAPIALPIGARSLTSPSGNC
jgi:hypothetical protein